ncbi:MAG: hypothetical protein JWO70_2537 [Betaproteobacteria bacterium]|nr:hypothetical protein [Betaproteobacteria bacterium]
MVMALALAPALAFAQAADVPYVATPQNVVDTMLDLAKVGPNDFLIDLGSGDGRIVITAAKKYGTRGFGVDLDGALVSEARREAERQGVKDKAEFYTRNIFVTDIGRATVLTTYLFSHVNIELRPKIFSELKPGTRVVSHEFDFGNWKPDAQRRVPVPRKPYGPPASDVYLWIVPANAAGRWQWRVPAESGAIEWEAALEQTFQALVGSARAGGNPAHIESATMRGEEIALVITAQVNAKPVRHELHGRIEGEAIRGTLRIAGAQQDLEWQATRVSRGKINIDAAAAAPALAAGF